MVNISYGMENRWRRFFEVEKKLFEVRFDNIKGGVVSGFSHLKKLRCSLFFGF